MYHTMLLSKIMPPPPWYTPPPLSTETLPTMVLFWITVGPPPVDFHGDGAVLAELDTLFFEQRALKPLGKIGQPIRRAPAGRVDHPLPRDPVRLAVEHPPHCTRRQTTGHAFGDLAVAHDPPARYPTHQFENLLLGVESLTFDIAVNSFVAHLEQFTTFSPSPNPTSP